jgi:hypothetical protein
MVTKIAGSLAVVVLGGMFLASEPFGMRVVDAQTGVGVSGLKVVSDNGIVCYTGKGGEIDWPEWSLVGRRVRFEISDANQQFEDAAVITRPMFGTKRQFAVHRRGGTTIQP